MKALCRMSQALFSISEPVGDTTKMQAALKFILQAKEIAPKDGPIKDFHLRVERAIKSAEQNGNKEDVFNGLDE